MPTFIKTDPIRLRQILLNLVDNAIKFTAEGSVSVIVSMNTSSRSAPMIRFQVQDTGIGIPDDKKEMIFDAFVQADGAITRRYGGTGLGLTIVRAFATQLGGKLVMSSSLAVGSTFVLDIPYHPCEVGEDGFDTEDTGTVFGLLAGLRVLLADDSDDIRSILSHLLDRSGAKVDCVANGSHVLQRVSQATYDLIVLDVHMPVLDGFATARELRRQGVDVPMLAMSADSTEATQSSCREAGFDRFVAKPFAARFIVRQIREAMDNQANGEFHTALKSDVVVPGSDPGANGRGAIRSSLAMRSPRFAEAIAAYVESIAGDIEHLDQSLLAGEIAEAREIIHRLVGSGGINGFDCVSEIATELRSFVIDGDIDSARKLVEQLRSIHGRMVLGVKTPNG